MVEKILLNGFWDWQLPGGLMTRKLVPSSYLCVGVALFQKDVELHPAPDGQTFLCLDGIAYKGRVWVNGTLLGELLPYIPYRIALRGIIQDGLNLIQVEIEDITADYGPTGGWEDYGGITRDVYLEVCGAAWIEDAHWQYALNEDLTAAQCEVEVSLADLALASDRQVSVALMLGRQTVYQDTKFIVTHTASVHEVFQFKVQDPLLWSPDSPVLYDLIVSLSAGEILDEKHIQVGFREIKTAGSRLFLNGKDIFLKGVARHEMWGDDQGFSLTRDQIERDLRLIKALGANFVRLVHYPHSKVTIELCNSLGLLATEEPGLWWSDLTDPAITTKALAIMEKTVLRDRNSPCILAWLLYNECPFPGQADYLTRGKALCNRLDPGRLVSAANCLDPEEAKHVFDQTGMDFYTYHPYSYEPDRMIQGITALRGKPLIFTEWGGYLFVDTPNIKGWFTSVLRQYAQNRDPLPNLAGMSYWQFQDVNQFSRGLPACVDGSLTEGLVDKYRNKKPMYDVMADLFATVEDPREPDYRVEITGPVVSVAETRSMAALDLAPYQASAGQKQVWENVLANLRVYQSIGQNQVRKTRGPVILYPLEDIGGLKVKVFGRPLILANGCQSIEIACGLPAERIFFLGQTSFFDGYPVRGRLGEVIARYIIHYENGESETIPLRNGYEMASASLIARTSRINALAANIRRVMTIHREEDWEVYQVGCMEVRPGKPDLIKNIEFISENDLFFPLLYGITLLESKQ